MASLYQKFLQQKIDLSPLGVEHSTNGTTYFCTPKGASIIGWAGVDGIHYCFIRGFGEMVFAVSPANTNPDYVHPLAESFADFLRLLLACGDAAALEQAWMWDEEQFDNFLRENPPTQNQNLIREIADKLKLTPMEKPWQYTKALQTAFDYGEIKYTADMYDPDMNVDTELKPPEWKVYFERNFWGHSGKDRAGKELPIGKKFKWADTRWLIPAIYSCRKGLVVEFCMQVESAQIRAFMDKWDLSFANEGDKQFTHKQQREIDQDNPLCFDFDSIITLNGKKLIISHACSVCYNPCIPEDTSYQLEAKWIIAHYGLDPAYGWLICRTSYPWKTKNKPVIHKLSLAMEQCRIPVPGMHFQAEKGDTIRFTVPQTGEEHILTVQEYEQQELPENTFTHSPDTEYPRHFSAMSYTIEPELAEDILTISDCQDSDRPRQAHCDPFAPIAENDVISIGVIGGADGPTSIVLFKNRRGNLRTVCSALHYEPVAAVEWQITFFERHYSNFNIELL